MENHVSFYESIIELSENENIKVSFFGDRNVGEKLLEKYKGISTEYKNENESFGNFFKRVKRSGVDMMICEQPYGTSLSFLFSFLYFNKHIKSKWIALHNINSWLFPTYAFNIRSFLVNLLHHWIIRKGDGIVVMNMNIKRYIVDTRHYSKRPVLYIPFALPKPNLALTKHTDTGMINIIVPGTINVERRDYDFVVRAFSKHLEQTKNTRVRLVFLGKPTGAKSDYSKILKTCDQINNQYGEKYIQYWNDFIPETEFEKEMSTGSFLLSNLNLNYKYKKNTEVYGESKESGIVSLMIKFGLPNIVIGGFKMPVQLQNHCIFADTLSELTEVFNQIEHEVITMDRYSSNFDKSLSEIKNEAELEFKEAIGA